MKSRHLNKISDIIDASALTADAFFLSPHKIIKGEGCAAQIFETLKTPDKTLVIADTYIMKTFLKNIDPELKLQTLIFKGECCPGEVFRIKTIIREKSIKEIIVLGGGKVMDLGKIIKGDQALRLITVPTSAATCAAYTPIAVIYTEIGVYMDTKDVPVPDALYIDYEFFKRLPMPFFAAGVADTLAKFYELSAGRELEKKKSLNDELIYTMGKIMVKTLTQIVMKKWMGMSDEVKKDLVDINIIVSGLISTIGKYAITSSMAHAVSYAVTINASARTFLHGEQVACGLMLQELCLGNETTVDELAAMFSILDLPQNFSMLGIKKKNLSAIMAFYEKLVKRENIYIPIDKNMVYNMFERHF